MIFLTGGTGFLGRHLLPALCRRGYPITIVSRHPEAHPWLANYPDIRVIQGDLTEKDRLLDAVQDAKYIIHAAGHFRFWGKKADFIHSNVIGTQNLLHVATKANIERFIHISSVAVIGQPDPTHIIDESSPPRPIDAYQHSKYEGEQLALKAYRDNNLPVIVLRPGAYYGPLGEYAFNRLFFTDPMRGIIMQIDGGHYISFPVYIADVVQAILQSMTQGNIGDIYHICGDWISHREAFDIICEEANLHWPRLNIPGWLGVNTARLMELIARYTGREPFWPVNLHSYVYNNWRVSNEKARCELNFEPTTFRDGARRTIEWYRTGKPQNIPETEC